ncbi:MAG: PrsW family intramembrane metalloprotease [Pseudonocardiales bacterium]|nr:PrsW family intramembrane metalloprotease [Pseudonocardiales bacterium]MBV9031356.1 PrsW family intramembrane metalloprotease [Pseudonocardiales bacterium]
MTTQRFGVPARGRQRRTRARRWAWLPVLLVGTGLFIAVLRALVITGNPTLVPSLLVLGALLVPVTFVVYMDGRNPDYDLPLSVLLSCALLGGVLGAAVASVLEFDTMRRLGGLPTVLIGLIEEAAKLLVPVGMLIFTRYRANPADGLLIGVAVGMGFAVLETLGYGFVTLLATGGDLTDVEGLLLLRGVLSPAGHAAWTGLAAAALWWAHAQRWRPRALAAAVGTFLLVVVLHALWDATDSWYGYLVIGFVSLALLLRQTHRNVLTMAVSAGESR